MRALVSKSVLLLASCGCLMLTTGCQGLARPQWLNPGTMQQQQIRAMVHDPYPDIDAGPEMTGVRPRQYDRPAAEATRNQPYAFWGN